VARSSRSKADRDGLTVHRPDPSRDRPRWPLLGGVAVVALTAGMMWPRACGVKFGGEAAEEPAASAAPSNEPPPVEPSVTAALDAGPPPLADGGSEPPALANVLVGKGTLMHCADPPGADLKPSKCGEHALDPHIVPKLETTLGNCAAVTGVAGKLALSLDLNFKTQAIKVLAGKGSATTKNGKRDDKAIEPLLTCVRSSLKELLAAESAPKPEHARYVLAYPVTITAQTAPAAPAASVEKEKATTGVAVVQVDTAIVRDAASTSGQPIGRLSRGTKVSTIGTSGNWFHVKFGENDAQEGWIFRTNIGK
jgi:hypothetical protein